MIMASAAVGSGGACECEDGRDGTQSPGPRGGNEVGVEQRRRGAGLT